MCASLQWEVISDNMKEPRIIIAWNFVQKLIFLKTLLREKNEIYCHNIKRSKQRPRNCLLWIFSMRRKWFAVLHFVCSEIRNVVSCFLHFLSFSGNCEKFSCNCKGKWGKSNLQSMSRNTLVNHKQKIVIVHPWLENIILESAHFFNVWTKNMLTQQILTILNLEPSLYLADELCSKKTLYVHWTLSSRRDL